MQPSPEELQQAMTKSDSIRETVKDAMLGKRSWVFFSSPSVFYKTEQIVSIAVEHRRGQKTLPEKAAQKLGFRTWTEP